MPVENVVGQPGEIAVEGEVHERKALRPRPQAGERLLRRDYVDLGRDGNARARSQGVGVDHFRPDLGLPRTPAAARDPAVRLDHPLQMRRRPRPDGLGVVGQDQVRAARAARPSRIVATVSQTILVGGYESRVDRHEPGADRARESGELAP